MKRRVFIKFSALASVLSPTYLALKKDLNAPTIQHASSDGEYIVINNWYLKKDDIKG